LGRGTIIAIAVVLVLLAGAGAAVGYAAWAMSGFANGEEVILTVPDGANASQVGEVLSDEDVIRSSLAFRVRARMLELDRELAAGDYALRRGMSVDEAIETLLGGPIPADVLRFTVPEGWTVAETLERLAEQTDHSVDDYRSVLDDEELEIPDWVPDLEQLSEIDGVREPHEGLLAPDTYEVEEDASARQILQRMVDQTDARMREVEDDRPADSVFADFDPYEMLVVASLLEREVQVTEELRTVAGVMDNRLEDGIQLQIDVTVLYALDRRGERVTTAVLDEAEESPYNTYQIEGIPPTPIGAPGYAAIQAAYSPEEHDYHFYVKVDEEGNHAFAETYSEHQENVEQLRELQRQAENDRQLPDEEVAEIDPQGLVPLGSTGLVPLGSTGLVPLGSTGLVPLGYHGRPAFLGTFLAGR
jgi:UPF0755 protein